MFYPIRLKLGRKVNPVHRKVRKSLGTLPELSWGAQFSEDIQNISLPALRKKHS